MKLKHKYVINEAQSDNWNGTNWWERPFGLWYYKRKFYYYDKGREFSIEAKTGWHWPGFTVYWGKESSQMAQLSVHFFIFSLYLTWYGFLAEKWFDTRECVATWETPPRKFTLIQGRTYGIRFFDKAVWWDCHSKEHEWSSRDPKWMSGSWHPLDTFLGRMKYKEGVPEEVHHRKIRFPERTYDLEVKLKNDRWWRPRWPFWPCRSMLRRCDIKVLTEGGIPVPGKGENSWDCGDDATHGLSGPANNLKDAVDKIFDSVKSKRERYGSGLYMYEKKSMADVKVLRGEK